MVVNQVAFDVISNDLTVTLAGEGGQLELTVMEPVTAPNPYIGYEKSTEIAR